MKIPRNIGRSALTPRPMGPETQRLRLNDQMIVILMIMIRSFQGCER
jgi:hypothetical protein